jgi:putative transposase
MAVIAYCFMPDHVHLLVEGCSDAADGRAFVHQAKQRSGYAVAQNWGGPLWQPSYYDHVLRDEDGSLSVARYILENPVRAGIVEAPRDYPFSGSVVYSFDEVLEAAAWQP